GRAVYFFRGAAYVVYAAAGPVPLADPPASHGMVELVVGSCADHSEHPDLPVFERMAERRADVAILLGDNCYYVNRLGSSSNSPLLGGWFRADWDDPRRMLLRQLAARNLPVRRAGAHDEPARDVGRS
ncbi:MAG TPA: hypothetical protein VHN14_11515, partial [Kofleriaceae bacterium]|nr:hypothetical protein [Kofleriaceae bacterium]